MSIKRESKRNTKRWILITLALITIGMSMIYTIGHFMVFTDFGTPVQTVNASVNTNSHTITLNVGEFYNTGDYRLIYSGQLDQYGHQPVFSVLYYMNGYVDSAVSYQLLGENPQPMVPNKYIFVNNIKFTIKEADYYSATLELEN